MDSREEGDIAQLKSVLSSVDVIHIYGETSGAMVSGS